MAELPPDPIVAEVDDLICDMITMLSLKRNKGKERQIIEGYAKSIVERIREADREEHDAN